MTFLLSFRGPSDDWDPQGYTDEDKTAEDLAELGMHTNEEKDEKKEDEEIVGDELGEGGDALVDEDDEEDEDLDGLSELEREAKRLQHDEIVMPFNDEE